MRFDWIPFIFPVTLYTNKEGDSKSLMMLKIDEDWQHVVERRLQFVRVTMSARYDDDRDEWIRCISKDGWSDIVQVATTIVILECTTWPLAHCAVRHVRSVWPRVWLITASDHIGPYGTASDLNWAPGPPNRLLRGSVRVRTPLRGSHGVRSRGLRLVL